MSKTNYNKKNIRGITLIALIVTIIVLLILAGIIVLMLTGDNGILNKVTEAKESTTDPTGQSNVSNVQKWVKYRIKGSNSSTDPSTTTYYLYYHRYNATQKLWGSDASAPNWQRHSIRLTTPLTYVRTTSIAEYYGSYTCPYCGCATYWIQDGTEVVQN